MSVRPAWPFRAALRIVPHHWRASVQADLADEAGGRWWAVVWCSLVAAGVGLSLHWAFTTAGILSDVRYAVRSLLHARAFAIGATATFAIGLGVNVAVFSAVDRMLFRALPYRDSGALVVMDRHFVEGDVPVGTVPATYVTGARHLPGIVDLSLSRGGSARYRLTAQPDEARYLTFAQVSYNMLGLLGVHPVVGRDFSEDDARTKRRVVLISYSAWQQDFGGRSDIVGQQLFAGVSAQGPAEIAGVLPADFIPPLAPASTESWNGVVVTADTFDAPRPTDQSPAPILRLRPGVTVAAAQAQVDALVTRLQPDLPAPRPGVPAMVVRLVPLHDAMFGRYETYLALVFAAATLVLLVGCANLASLLLVRAGSRERRTAVQIALGASSGRLLQAAVIEALMLAVAGSALALLVLQLGHQLIAAWLPPLLGKYAAPMFEARVLVFSSLVAMVSAILAGALPGWRSARVDVLAILHQGSGRSGAGPLRGSGTMLAAEVAVSLVLVACAALTGRSLVGLLRADIGFDLDRLQVVAAYLPASADAASLRRQYVDMLETIRAVPGVQAAAGADLLPILGALSRPMRIGDDPRGQRWAVTDGFVEAMGMRLVAGRTVSKAEVQSVAPVGMLSEAGARLVWPGIRAQEAVGRFVEFPNEPPRQIIGVVSDVRGSYDQTPFPSLYVPVEPSGFQFLLYAIRTAPGPTLTPADLTHRLQQAGFPVTPAKVTPAVDRFNLRVADQKFRAQLFSAFGAVALLLAVVGLYAVQSFHVSLRKSELAIRISLGATPADVRGMLLRQSIRPALAGVVLGLAGTYWAAQFLQALLVNVDARDPWTYAAVGAVLAATAVAAMWLPARRAARTDPAAILRAQ